MGQIRQPDSSAYVRHVSSRAPGRDARTLPLPLESPQAFPSILLFAAASALGTDSARSHPPESGLCGLHTTESFATSTWGEALAPGSRDCFRAVTPAGVIANRARKNVLTIAAYRAARCL